MTTSTTADASTADLLDSLRRRGVAGIDTSTLTRAAYSSDASNYRVVPEVVAFPHHTDDVVAIVDAARETSTPITARGGGTSVAGNAIGPGIVIDFSRHLNRVLNIDPNSRRALVEPGATMGSVQRAAAPFGLRFGPDPSTWARATIGGMVGNNACGPRALAFGRTADNVQSLDLIDGRGHRFEVSTGFGQVEGLESLVMGNLALIRTELGKFKRQVSGYSLEHLLPENGRNLARALVGTEGTCGVLLGAEIDLVEIPHEPVLVVLGYPDMASAADAVPALIAHGATAIEGMDSRLVDAVVARQGASAIPELPRGNGWMLIEVTSPRAEDALDRARRLAEDSGAFDVRILESGPEARAIWRMREDGAGLAGRTPSNRQAWPGVEDAAVPPENLGRYLREFDSLLAEYGFEGMPYGHFGDGCVHVRLDIPLEHDGVTLRRFMNDAATLITSHGGSLSGEHGDGRARSELLGRMYSPDLLDLFAQFKALFDPGDILNPGVVVRPAPLDADLRRPAALDLIAATGMSFAHDDSSFTKAIHRCVGVGKCRADNHASGGFMCPSYQATKDEKDSTRGRARVLQEMANGSLVTGGWRSPEVHDALDLCLSCKACSSDCPAGVDMAAYKAETLYRSYKGRIRPINHYTLGWMPRWARLATSGFSGIANTLMSIRPLEKAVLWAGGMDTRRTIPAFAPRPFRRRHRAEARSRATSTSTKTIILWVDTFSDNFSPSIAEAAIEVLESAGFNVQFPQNDVCCGLTWISTGQLDGARARLRHLVDEFAPLVDQGIPVVGLEPSCTAVLRSDLIELIPDDARARAVSSNTYTIAELLAGRAVVRPDIGWTPPRLDGLSIVVQPHCHHHSVMGFSLDERLLESLGAELDTISGCCGLAGNFGMERGHYDVSVAVAENNLLPALRRSDADAVFLADGLSCRTQADQLAGVKGSHLVEILAAALKSPERPLRIN